MAPSGRKPKPAGQAVTRHRRSYDWVDVEQVPFDGPKLPPRRRDGSVAERHRREMGGLGVDAARDIVGAQRLGLRDGQP